MISPSAISPLNRKVVDVAFTGLLDDYSGAAAAYSVRRLSSTYTGALMEVRRTVSSTTVTANVAYDSNNELSLDSEITVTGGSSSATNLGEFVAATGYSDPDSLGSGQDSFVRTWYDQSGNSNNAQQTTTSNQTQIVSSGSMILENGKPALNFDGSDDFMNLTSTITTSTYSSFATIKKDLTNSRFAPAGLYEGQSVGAWNDGNLYENNGTSFVKVVYTNNTNQNLFSVIKNGNTLSDFSANQNGSSLGSYSGTPFTSISIDRLGARNNVFSDGNMQEIFIYTSDQSSNRTGIETNINSYFSIY